MKTMTLALCLLVAAAPLALAGPVAAEAPPADAALAVAALACGGAVCEALCEVNEALDRPCLR